LFHLEIIDALLELKVKAGAEVIKQGDDGDFFYFVQSGHFEIFVPFFYSYLLTLSSSLLKNIDLRYMSTNIHRL